MSILLGVLLVLAVFFFASLCVTSRRADDDAERSARLPRDRAP